MLDNLFLEVLNLTITGSFVILGVIVARLLLMKCPKKYSYLLWAIVLVRLLVPISWESDLSLIPISNQSTFTTSIFDGYVGTTHTYWDITPEYQIAIDNGITPIQVEGGGSYVVTGEDGFSSPDTVLSTWLLTIWMTGMTAMAVYGLVQYFLLKRKLATAIPLEKGIYLADNIPSPFVLGLVSPKIYLPSHLEEGERAYIVAHEHCHLKRFDHITRVLAFFALAIHWFNPLVWVAFVLSERDMELSCDEAVMGTMEGDIRRDYANSLLRFATRGRLISATPLAFGEGDTKHRVKNVIAYKKPVVWVTLVAVVLAVCVGVGLMSNAKEQDISSERLTEPYINATDTIGAAVIFDYMDEDILVFHGYFGLFVYDFNKEEILFGVDLEQAVGTNLVQGSSPANVGVDGAGETIMLWSDYLWTEDEILYAYYIDAKTGAYEKKLYEAFAESSPSTDSYPFEGNTLGTLQVTADGTTYLLFEEYPYQKNQASDGDDNSLDQAISDGAFVYNSDGVIAGREYLDTFEEAAANREDATLRRVYQYTLDGAEEPTSAVTDIVYADELFTVTQYPSTPEDTLLQNTYQYLVTETVPPMSSTAKYETCRAHYLVNDPDVTYWDYMSGLLSSQLGAGEDAYVIYVEYTYPEE